MLVTKPVTKAMILTLGSQHGMSTGCERDQQLLLAQRLEKERAELAAGVSKGRYSDTVYSLYSAYWYKRSARRSLLASLRAGRRTQFTRFTCTKVSRRSAQSSHVHRLLALLVQASTSKLYQ
jgi:hypothetical protein